MSIQTICNNCFTGTGGLNPCPQCGFDNRTAYNNPQQLPLGTLLNRQYLIGRALGQGGFGITYLGFDLSSNQRMAIKEYFPSGLVTRQAAMVQPITQETQTAFIRGVDAFYREARILARLVNYPNIVSVINFFQENGTAYFVMEYIEGQSFKDYLESRGGRIPFEEALFLLMPVMQSLDAVHKEGMLHRDIAPDNIYITNAGPTKLLDFGAARFHEEEDTHSVRTIIKPGYAPMEQYASGSAQGPWTDVYAMGATFYRAVTGIVPPDAPTRALHDDLRSPAQSGIILPANADNAIMRAMALNIVFRFRSIADFGKMLVRIDSLPVQNARIPNSPQPQPYPVDLPTQRLNQIKQSEPVTQIKIIQPPVQVRKTNRLVKWIVIAGIVLLLLLIAILILRNRAISNSAEIESAVMIHICGSEYRKFF